MANEKQPITDMTSGYLLRGKEHLPQQLAAWPWRVYQLYWLDVLLIGWAPLSDPKHVRYADIKKRSD